MALLSLKGTILVTLRWLSLKKLDLVLLSWLTLERVQLADFAKSTVQFGQSVKSVNHQSINWSDAYIRCALVLQLYHAKLLHGARACV